MLACVLFIAAIAAVEPDTEDSYSSNRDVRLPTYQDMHFPDADGGKMTRTPTGATWEGKKGNFDISVNVDDKGNHFEMQADWGKDNTKR
jgi:hypothetical protein